MWNVLAVASILIVNFVTAQSNEQVSNVACPATYFQLSDSPYENYFVSTCNFAATVVALTPNPDSNLTLIGPRLIAAFPAGNHRIAYAETREFGSCRIFCAVEWD